MAKKTVAVLIPAYNEEEVLGPLYERLRLLGDTVGATYNVTFCFVDDGSHDETLPELRRLAKKDDRVQYISLSRNFGKEAAMLAGFDYTQRYAATVIIDADLQDPPELIPEMLRLWEEGYDDVYAKRRSRKGESWLKKLTSTGFYAVLQRLTRVPIQRNTGDFRLLSRRLVEAIVAMRETQRYTKGMFSWVGFNKKEILYDRDPRAAGTTKWNYWKLTELAIEGILSFTTAPLRIASLLGIVTSVGAAIYIAYLLVRPLFGVAVGSGYASIMAVVLFLGGVQLLSLGIIGEYVGRIFNETKGRPAYYVKETSEDNERKTS